MPRPPSGPLPLALPRRRIYILPSKFGLLYGTALLALMVGSLNYNNNAAILLSLLLAATAMASSASNVFFLSGLRLVDFQADEAFAGSPQSCRLHLRARKGAVRGEVSMQLDEGLTVPGQPGDDGDMVFAWRWPSHRRGRRRLGRITLSSCYPLGLFHAWCPLEPALETVVYAAPETPPAPLPQSGTIHGERERPRHGSEEWHALREFQRGDSLREIAWKTSARHDRWLVHETRDGSQQEELRFSLDQVVGMERERGLSRLTRWLLMAEATQRAYTLVLGEKSIGPGRGAEHRRRVLTALADLP